MAMPKYGRERSTPPHVKGHDNPAPVVSGPIHHPTRVNTGQYADFRFAAEQHSKQFQAAGSPGPLGRGSAPAPKPAKETLVRRQQPVSKGTPVPKRNK